MTPLDRLGTREFFGVKLGLDAIRTLTAALGHPERAFLPVIIAGTNGKGSVAAMTSRALKAAGVRAGRYTSPHLVHVRERFTVDEQHLDDDALSAALATVFDVEQTLLARGDLEAPVTYFELTTAAALVAFRDAGVRIGLLEVGLGGRHDATNVVQAPLAAITSIGFDHMAQLGTTLEAIAGEKAGVIAPGAVVIRGEMESTAVSVIEDVATAQGARLVRALDRVEADVQAEKGETTLRVRTPTRAYGPVRLALKGAHQIGNAIVAVRLLESLGAFGLEVDARAIETGLADASWPGRIERRRTARGVDVVLDGAHNPQGAEALAQWLEAAGYGPVTLVMACMRDKDVRALLAPLLPHVARVVATALDFPRALPAEDLAALVRELAPHVPVETCGTPVMAVNQAAAASPRVLVAGSLFLVGAVRDSLDPA